MLQRQTNRFFGILAVTTCAWVGHASANTGKEIKYTPNPTVFEKLPAPKRGGTLYLALSNNPKFINPIVGSDANSASLEPFFWATLFSEDPDTLAPFPYLAETYTISPDRKTYTFTLNKNARWEDGTPVTTDDVKFTFDSLMNPKVDAAALRSYWEGVQVKVIDKQTFQFSVTEAKFDTLRALYLFAPFQKKQFEKEPDLNKAKGILSPVGNGPYRFKSFSRDQTIVAERNKDWWGYSLPQFKPQFNADTVVFRIIPDPNLEYEKFLKGEIDLIDFNQEQFARKVKGVDKDKFGADPKDKKSIWALEVQNKAPRGFQYVGWNLRSPLFNSVKTRTALAHIVDYKQIIDKVYYGLVYQSTSPFGSLTKNAAPDLRQPGKLITTDRKKALALLREDGWADSDGDNVLDKTIDGKKVPFRFVLKYNANNPLRGKIAQIVKENFRAAGIGVEVNAMEWNSYLDDVDKRNFDAVLLSWTGTAFPNPRQIWHTTSQENQGSNYVGYSNPKVDALIEKANAEMDLDKRATIMQEINRLIYADQPYAFLTEPRSLLAGFTKKVKAPAWAYTYNVAPAWYVYTFEQ